MSTSQEENPTTFCPSDQELVVEYLRAKNKGLPLPTNKIVDHVDLCMHHPDSIAEAHGERNTHWYFFTQSIRRYKNRRPNQAAGNGYWRAVGAHMAVKYNGEVVGLRRHRVYYTKDGDKTKWMMHEFRLYEPDRGLPITNNDDGEKPQRRPRAEEWVLCRIFFSFTRERQELSDHLNRLTV